MQYGHDQHEQQRLQQQQQQQQQQAFNVRPPATQLPPPAVPSGDSAPWAHLLSDAPAQAGLMQQAPGIGTFGGLPGSSAAGGANAPLIPHLWPGWERAAGLGLSHMHRRTWRTHDDSRLRSGSPPALPVEAAVPGGCSGVRGAQLLPECEGRGGE